MKIALVQQFATPDPIQNLEKGIQALRQAASDGASMVCFAELAFDRFFPQYRVSESVTPHAEPLDGPTTQRFCELAREYGYFTALCNRVGVEGQMEFSGESFICGPDGRIRSRAAKAKEEILLAEIDLQETKTCPAARLFLKDRRPELYQKWFRVAERD